MYKYYVKNYVLNQENVIKTCIHYYWNAKGKKNKQDKI